MVKSSLVRNHFLWETCNHTGKVFPTPGQISMHRLSNVLKQPPYFYLHINISKSTMNDVYTEVLYFNAMFGQQQNTMEPGPMNDTASIHLGLV